MPLRSLRDRLALLFFAITLAAIGVVYLYVVPPLESHAARREAARAGRRRAAATRRRSPTRVGADVDVSVVDRLVRARRRPRQRARDAAAASTAARGGLQTYAVARTPPAEVDIRDLQFAVARERRAARGRVGDRHRGRRGGPRRPGGAAAVLRAARGRARSASSSFSAPLDDVEGNVALVRRRILVAGGDRAARRAARPAGSSRARSRGASGAWSGRRAAVAAGDFSRALRRRRATTSSASSRARSTTCSASSAQLDSARKRFIATASHELRTPIFSLGGFLELLAGRGARRGDARAVPRRRCASRSSACSKLATDLLDLSRLEAGSLELRPEPTDVGVLARAVAAEFGPALAAHDSHLELRLAGEPIEAVCDPERVAPDHAHPHRQRARPTRRPAPTSSSAPRARRTAAAAPRRAATSARGIQRTALAAHLRAVLHLRRRAGLGPRAGDRPRAGRAHGRARSASTRAPGRTTFTLELPA